jgi:hypothetical protein
MYCFCRTQWCWGEIVALGLPSFRPSLFRKDVFYHSKRCSGVVCDCTGLTKHSALFAKPPRVGCMF